MLGLILRLRSGSMKIIVWIRFIELVVSSGAGEGSTAISKSNGYTHHSTSHLSHSIASLIDEDW